MIILAGHVNCSPPGLQQLLKDSKRCLITCRTIIFECDFLNPMPPILLTLGLRDTEIQRGLFKFVALNAIGSKWMAMCWT